MPEKNLFRQKALLAYKRNIEKDVVLRFVSWPIIVSLWLLLGIFLVAGLFAWYAQVPVYVTTAGVLVQDTALSGSDGSGASGGTTVALLLLTEDQATRLRVGLHATLQVGTADQAVQCTLVQVEPERMSPDVIRQRFHLNASTALLVTQPSWVALMQPVTPLPATSYAGSSITARIEIGSQRLLTLFFSSGQFMGSTT